MDRLIRKLIRHRASLRPSDEPMQVVPFIPLR